MHRLQDTLSNSLQISEPKPFLSQSPDKDLAVLARNYLERPAVAKREAKPGARQRILARVQSAFESAGIWEHLNKNIPVAKYTYAGDPLKIDCGYRPNGVIRLFHAVALPDDPDAAKILAFSYVGLADGIARLEKAKADLTAIVEDDLDRNDEAIRFGIQTLERASIRVVEVRDLQDIAQRARGEMRL